MWTKGRHTNCLSPAVLDGCGRKKSLRGEEANTTGGAPSVPRQGGGWVAAARDAGEEEAGDAWGRGRDRRQAKGRVGHRNGAEAGA